MLPWLALIKPEMMENSVVLPAPLGPINAVIRPSGAMSDAAFTANRPPKRRETRSTTSRGSAMGCLHWRRACQQATRSGKATDQPARRESDHQDQHCTIDDEVETRRIARKQARTLAQRFDHQRSKQRAEHGTDAPDNRRQQRFDRNPSTVGDAGIDEQEILRIEAAGRGRDRPGDHHSSRLYCDGVDAERLCRVLVLAHRNQPGAEPRALDHLGHQQRKRDQCEHNPIKRRAALKLKRLCAHIELDQRADTGAGDRRDAGNNAQHLRESERHEREIRAAQAGTEGQRSDDSAGQRTGGDADDEARPSIDAVAHLQDGGDIGTRAEKRGVAERILPAIAAKNVPALPGKCDHQCDDEKVKHYVGMHDQRHRRQHRDNDDDRPEASHARAPNNPLGRTSSTTMKMMKIPTWPRESPRNRLDTLSTTPITRPPISAPGTDPMPPSTTMVKATSTKALPALGLT